MSETPISIMVDTNVWVDSFCQWHMRTDSALRLFRAARKQKAELLYPAHCLKDILYLLTHEYKRKALEEEGHLSESMSTAIKQSGIAAIRAIMEYHTAVGSDGSDLWLADKYLPIHSDFEDNLVLAACRRAKVDYLVTNDKRLIKHANVLAKTPDDMADLLEAGQAFKQGVGLAPSEISWQFRP